ncbi:MULTISPECIES: hypothetical protein [unclassified Corallococcus]|uniref:hypothetical protein n=1 Tax=unclassified Corallococcus TaxID=2685029 RepID=UPI001A8C0C72|nr:MULTISPECIES: hypothetical protein [unclassified Corallococcus]MBN9685679.1 hypothetical protein [Corallococcus sp. NCSPR001]WAS82876.1 hypothetical protein O0N60_26550 [Corallococcus sp. NCRR]
MKADKPSLNGHGNIYRAPVLRKAPALYKSVKVRPALRSDPVILDPGLYVYWVQLQGGDGAFTIKAYRDGEEQPFAEYSSDTAKSGFHGINFLFGVAR